MAVRDRGRPWIRNSASWPGATRSDRRSVLFLRRSTWATGSRGNNVVFSARSQAWLARCFRHVHRSARLRVITSRRRWFRDQRRRHPSVVPADRPTDRCWDSSCLSPGASQVHGPHDRLRLSSSSTVGLQGLHRCRGSGCSNATLRASCCMTPRHSFTSSRFRVAGGLSTAADIAAEVGPSKRAERKRRLCAVDRLPRWRDVVC
jgi:hypothetical protein